MGSFLYLALGVTPADWLRLLPVAVALAALVLFWLLRRSQPARAAVLVLLSFLFFANWSPVFLAILFLVAVADYYLGAALVKPGERSGRRVLLAISVLLNIGLLIAMRYFGLLTTLGNVLLAAVGAKIPDVVPAPPLGVFLFLLQSLGYTADMYHRRTEPLRSLPDYLVFVSFFPRLFAGPMLTAADFAPHWRETPTMSRERFGMILFLVISGVVKKVVFAEYLALNLVDKVFDLPTLFSTTENLLALYAYAIQLYCELSAYTDLALAAGLLVGLEMPVNFRFPYQATNVREFWRRWFVTLSGWVRNHVYIPLAGPRGQAAWRIYPALLISMVLVGLANGLTWTFVLWGVLQGLALVVTEAIGRRRSATDVSPAVWRRLIGVFLTFHFMVLTWAIYRSASIETFGNILSLLQEGIWVAPNLTWPVVAVLVAGLAGAWFPSLWFERLRGFFVRLPLPLQLALAAIVFLLVFKVSTAGAIPFVYERL